MFWKCFHSPYSSSFALSYETEMLLELQVKWPIIIIYMCIYPKSVNIHESFKRSSYPSTFRVLIGKRETSTYLR